MSADATFVATCPMCGKAMTVKDGVAICNHYPPDAKILIQT